MSILHNIASIPVILSNTPSYHNPNAFVEKLEQFGFHVFVFFSTINPHELAGLGLYLLVSLQRLVNADQLRPPLNFIAIQLHADLD